jgi:hypothetical protein
MMPGINIAAAQALIDEATLVPTQGVKPFVSLTRVELLYHQGDIDEAERVLANIDVANCAADERLIAFKLLRDIALKRQDLTSYVKWNNSRSTCMNVPAAVMFEA